MVYICLMQWVLLSSMGNVMVKNPPAGFWSSPVRVWPLAQFSLPSLGRSNWLRSGSLVEPKQNRLNSTLVYHGTFLKQPYMNTIGLQLALIFKTDKKKQTYIELLPISREFWAIYRINLILRPRMFSDTMGQVSTQQTCLSHSFLTVLRTKSLVYGHISTQLSTWACRVWCHTSPHHRFLTLISYIYSELLWVHKVLQIQERKCICLCVCGGGVGGVGQKPFFLLGRKCLFS